MCAVEVTTAAIERCTRRANTMLTASASRTELSSATENATMIEEVKASLDVPGLRGRRIKAGMLHMGVEQLRRDQQRDTGGAGCSAEDHDGLGDQQARPESRSRTSGRYRWIVAPIHRRSWPVPMR